MKIYLIRHGETTGDVEDRYGGDYDDELTQKGTTQAKELAEKFSDRGIKIIYSSPRKRAAATSQILSEKIHAPIKFVDNLRERNNYGVLTGLTKKEAAEKLPFDVKELASGVNHKVKLSERFDAFKGRVLGAFRTVVNDSDEDIAIVTHSGPLRRISEEHLMKKISKTEDCAFIVLEQKGDGFELIESKGISFE
ncbi:2,3-bisphosphoglycerate-dependent phosphoglycerate mutase [uncultured archaeon]|nr:2,3-bisphosphoglycerate-dependent phosphoglycerate mutase [uncultured archaeon]